jgi:hypothetical protein
LIAGTASALVDLRRWLQQGLHQGLCRGANQGLRNDNYPGLQAATYLDPCDDVAGMGSMLNLVGAGPGLTPAGDDLLAGVMLALYRVGRPDMALVLWHRLTPILANRTHEISAAHLRQAASGLCNDATAQVFDQVLGCEVLCPTVLKVALTASGSGSAWDTLGGMTLVVDAWLDNIAQSESYTVSVTGWTTG